MMIGLGIDLVKNSRIMKSCNENFVNQVLTKKEQENYYHKIGKKHNEYICGRFAAKEAIIKALSKYDNPHMLEIEIINNDIGTPIVKFKDYNIILSISHEEEYTIAEAIVLKN